jgi:hypothetical protein
LPGSKLDTWRIEGVTLVLYGTAGRSLAFYADDSGGFFKAAKEGGKPLVLVKAR